MKIHCQPPNPSMPSMYRIAPEIGEPIRPATGMATMKMPTMMAR